MKKSILIGLIDGISGLAIGYKVSKDRNVDYKTDVREGYDGPFNVLSQFPSKQAAQDCYEGDYQNIIPLRKGAIDMNFRIVEKKIQFSNQ